jgi:hypothetical protein
VVGFHGTNHAAVSRLLAGDVRRSDQHFEWLGTGFYLWQDSPWHAQRWATDRFGDDAAVVVAMVSLDACLDLLTHPGTRHLPRLTTGTSTTASTKGVRPR